MTPDPSSISSPGELDINDVGGYTIAKSYTLDARRIMAYAASINDTNEAYFDDTRNGGLSVHPAICFSLQWNTRFRPDLKPNLRAAPFGVHAETDLRIHKPFKQNEIVTVQGQLISRKKIAPGVFSVDRFRMTNSQGELLAELDYNGITRGATLNGADQEIEPSPQAPTNDAITGTPDWVENIYIPRHAGQQYTECANIYNPIHTERSVALAAGLPDIILHGSATKAHALTTIINRCFDGDPGRITRLYGQLRAMVLMDTTITVQCLGCITVNEELQVFYRVLNEDGAPAIANGVICGKTD
jgi:acyl dehydratase